MTDADHAGAARAGRPGRPDRDPHADRLRDDPGRRRRRDADLNGPALLLSQLKTLAYGQFSIYDLSVVPMFVLMGALAARPG